MTAPHRQKKHDRLTYGIPATKEEIACDFAVAPLDRIALDMDRKWGVDRLVELMPPDIAAKYGARLAELNEAVEARDANATAAVVAKLIANLHRMDQIAVEAGNKPLAPEVWTFDIDGFRFGLMREGGDWPAAQAAMPGLTLYSPREVANALRAYGQTVVAVKQAFPGAEAVAVRPRTELEESLDDEIPF